MTNGPELGNGCSAHLQIPGHEDITLPLAFGQDGSLALEVASLQPRHGIITLDPSFGSTGSTRSGITHIDPVGDGKEAKLQYRGYAISQLAEQSSVLETAYLLLFGALPTRSELDQFVERVREETVSHTFVQRVIESMPQDAHPMCLLGTAVNALQAQYADDQGSDQEAFDRNVVRLIAQLPILAAWSHSHRAGTSFQTPDQSIPYVENYLRMVFAEGCSVYAVDPLHAEIMSKIFILHADHEQNASTTTVRNIKSTGANLYSSVSGGIGALWGPLHGGANEKVVQMLQGIHNEGLSAKDFILRAKSGDTGDRLMGFGHRVYKAYDPRAQVMKELCAKFFASQHTQDPLLQIAADLEQTALQDDYFVKRKLYPNVDFYSGVLLHGLGIPSEEFTVIFALGRISGWLAQARELHSDPTSRIARPRQLYTGELDKMYQPISQR